MPSLIGCSHTLNYPWVTALLPGHADDLMSPLFIHSLSPGRFKRKLTYVIFKLNSVIDAWDISSEIDIRWTSLNLTDDKSLLVQVVAWCHQAMSHYLDQCWPRFISPYGITRPQWVKYYIAVILNCVFSFILYFHFNALWTNIKMIGFAQQNYGRSL